MNAILVLDTETTGVAPPPASRVVEVGVILWSVTHATTIAQYAMLVDGPSNPAHYINRIPPAALSEGASEGSVWERLTPWVTRADAIVGHSCRFDRQFVPNGWDQGKPWICSMSDIEWPQYSSSRSLIAICLAHRLGVEKAHRALTDCDLIVRLLERCHEMGHDVRDMLTQASRPKALYQALVTYDERDKAKASGFEWDASSKRWLRMICPENANAFPFRTQRVEGAAA
jgi:DNA polymerase III subunit epsilon